MTTGRRRPYRRAWLCAVTVFWTLALAGCLVRPAATGTPAPAPAQITDPASGLRWVNLADLPPEASETLAEIRQGPPFPARKDGSVFGNRERLLPRQASGYYREFTVPTPGSDDRGARRIVAGGPRYGTANGEFYYTGDHYRSFERIRT